jgi:predicted transcriptional regulator/RimJ/RimL family protein N-acetyltransferase
MESKVNGVVLSIKREHAERIFEGSKHFELRKSLPLSPFRRVYLYVGGDGVVGCFDATRVIREEKNKLWNEVNYRATTRFRFDKYFESWSSGCAIEVARPIRFATPIGAKALRDVDSGFRAPMSAVLLNLDSPLGTFLEKKRAYYRRRMGPDVTLISIEKKDRPIYKKWVLRHIGLRYEGIDESFAERNLGVHDLGHDPSGFFTARKQVLSIMRAGERVGFTTITWKNGGCAKTGPTILESKFRGQGLGRAARRAVELLAGHAGYRKIYCTCADDAYDVIQYLLDAGMKVEAHLDRQYSGDHGELIFGKFLVADEYYGARVRRRGSFRGKVLDISSIEKGRLRDSMVELFSQDWTPIDETFADRVLAGALTKGKPDARDKAKRIVCMGDSKRIYAMTILLPKRGGAVKALLCTATEHKGTLQQMIEEVSRLSCGWNSRKVYFLHPLLDSSVVAVLRESRFQLEGILKAPYKPGEDVGILSRFC